MRTKNARPLDDDEAAWIADVKSVPCVFCDAPAPVEAHHVWQGHHFVTVAACHACHEARVWNLGGMTEHEAVNETTRRVVRFRAGKPINPAPRLRTQQRPRAKRSALAPSSKILPRREAQAA